MSDPKLLKICENARISGLARGSLLLVSMPWLMAGCLVPDPEKFPEPRSRAPVLNVPEAVPVVTQIVRPVNFAERFSVPYQSEDDVGDFPVAFLFMDFRTPAQKFLGNDPFFSELDKTFTIDASFADVSCAPTAPTDPNTACCHQVTLLATHRSKLVNEGGLEVLDTTVAKDDLAMLVWWVAVPPPGTPAGTNLPLGRCPTPTTPSSP
jgi:hypothetical protein